jgi:hypothetical protein
MIRRNSLLAALDGAGLAVGNVRATVEKHAAQCHPEGAVRVDVVLMESIIPVQKTFHKLPTFLECLTHC